MLQVPEGTALSRDSGNHGVLPEAAHVCALRGAQPLILLRLFAPAAGPERGGGELPEPETRTISFRPCLPRFNASLPGSRDG